MLLERRYLAIYLQDHLAGSIAGCELARRSRASHAGTELGELFAELVEELDDDRERLREIMRFLEVDADRLKQLGAWGGEKLGRLKLNGSIVRPSPLSRLTELEGLYVGVSGKLSMWENLQRAMGERLQRFDLEELIARAESQRQRIETARLQVAAEVLGEAQAGA